MINRRRLLIGGTAIGAAVVAAPFAAYELAQWQPANLPVREDVVAWLRDNAIPLATAVPGSGFQDLEFLRAAVGDARIVSLGEATHGTREFFQLKHRVIEFCVTELGFTLIAFEANYGDVLAVNDYVLNGNGNVSDVVDRGMGLLFWKTAEVVALVEWVRAWNVAHERKVQFHGFDMQWVASSVQYLLPYLRRVAPGLAATSEPVLAPLLSFDWYGRDSNERATVLRLIEEILASFDAERARWIGQTDEMEWSLARLAAVTMDQFARTPADADEGYIWRDRCMADNVRALLDAAGPQSKALLWAHNLHVQHAPFLDLNAMGNFLRTAFGAQQVVIGFSFDRGGFRAVGRTSGEIEDQTVGPAPAGFLDAALARTALPLLALDLRRVPPDGPVAAWMASKPMQRCITAQYAPETRWYTPLYWYEKLYHYGYAFPADPRENYDLLFFVATTHPTRAMSL
jgi:erythromycin esterase